MWDFAGKTAVVTGGNSGIGHATAALFKKGGGDVVITGRNKEATEAAAQEIGAIGITSDQSKLSEIDELVAAVKEKFGSVDVLVVSAAVAEYALVQDISEAQYDAMMDVNFKGPLFLLQKFLPILSDGAAVVHVSSINAYSGMPLTCAYAGSKAALNSLTRTAATELAPRKIRVNAVNPGATNTPVWGKVGLSEEELEATAAAMQERIPFKRFGEPEEVAGLIAFLASDHGKFITGSELTIDGGTNVNPILG